MDYSGLETVDIPNSLKDEICGWLEPNGDFIKCDYMEHLNVAYERYHTYDLFELAQQGIVHVYWDPIKNKPNYYTERCLTDIQIKWLEEHGFTIYEEDIGQI